MARTRQRVTTRGNGAAQSGPGGLPQWLVVSGLGLALLGLAASVYLAVAHFTSPAVLACSERGLVNCRRVTTSPQSKLLGIPVAFLGVGFFLALIPLLLPAAWRSPDRRMAWMRVSLISAGIAFVVYLVYAELFLVDAVCLWCSVVHTDTLLLFALVMLFGLPAHPITRAARRRDHRP